jgi:hypothetical protein
VNVRFEWKADLVRPLSNLVLEVRYEGLNRLGRAVRQLSSSVAEKICPVTKRIRVNWVIPQAPSTLHG